MAQAEKERDFQEEADQYGRGSVRDMAEELAALEHAQEARDGGECGADGAPCTAGADSEDPEAWHDEERARRWIEESPLSVEVRSGWYSPGGEPGEPEEYAILLGTGGPAARIRGELDSSGYPETAVFEYQDWFKPWTPARLDADEESTLLQWARTFYFGS